LTDSGTIVEETAVLGIPTIQMRKSTERPEVYEFGSAIKFDPDSESSISSTLMEFHELKSKSWKHTLGDGKASYRIVEDLVKRYKDNNFNGHQPSKREPFSIRSFSN
jgi:UDP-N-acetylglucosamine 2-epimerase (non-hydrolysing)